MPYHAMQNLQPALPSAVDGDSRNRLVRAQIGNPKEGNSRATPHTSAGQLHSHVFPSAFLSGIKILTMPSTSNSIPFYNSCRNIAGIRNLTPKRQNRRRFGINKMPQNIRISRLFAFSASSSSACRLIIRGFLADSLTGCLSYP